MQASTDKLLADIRIDVLNENFVDGLPFRFCAHAYGYILFFSDEWELEHESLADKSYYELEAVIRRALQLGCTMINFDRDAEEVEGLTTFEW
jgi:hypothetical protein